MQLTLVLCCVLFVDSKNPNVDHQLEAGDIYITVILLVSLNQKHEVCPHIMQHLVRHHVPKKNS